MTRYAILTVLLATPVTANATMTREGAIYDGELARYDGHTQVSQFRDLEVNFRLASGGKVEHFEIKTLDPRYRVALDTISFDAKLSKAVALRASFSLPVKYPVSIGVLEYLDIPEADTWYHFDLRLADLDGPPERLDPRQRIGFALMADPRIGAQAKTNVNMANVVVTG